MCHKAYYDKKMLCMKLGINDIVFVRVKVFGNDRKVADKWETSPYRVVEQIGNRPVFRVQNLEDMTKIRMLHRNMLYPLKMVQDDGAQQDTLVEHVNIQLATANQLMYEHFYSP